MAVLNLSEVIILKVKVIILKMIALSDHIKNCWEQNFDLDAVEVDVDEGEDEAEARLVDVHG